MRLRREAFLTNGAEVHLRDALAAKWRSTAPGPLFEITRPCARLEMPSAPPLRGGEMVSILRLSVIVAAVAAFAAFTTPASSGVIGEFAEATGPNAGSVLPRRYQNCRSLNRVYRHGVGRWGARDKTSGVPVTNFKRSNILYRLNRGLDRDKDLIACEKR
jgi:hypothetical protein